MNNLGKVIFGVMLAASLHGCDLFDGSRLVVREPEPPPAPDYTVTVESVNASNADTGQQLDVGGVPVEGGVLAKD